MPRTISADAARRIAVAAQGLATPRPDTVDVRHFRRVVRQVKVIQLDSVNVAARTHYMPFFSRLGAYDREKLDAWTSTSGELFEYWCHAASLAPMEHYGLFDWRRKLARPWTSLAEIEKEHPGYVDAVYRQVVENGPMTASDLENSGARAGEWWGWSDGKLVLEYLFAQGRITSYRGPNFSRVYDIPERVIPEQHRSETPTEQESYRSLLGHAAEAFGIATAKDLADYYRMKVVPARATLDAMVAAGELIDVTVTGWSEPAYLHPDAKQPRTVIGRALLSPFDSMVWERDRTLRIFDFHYRIEIYVPKPKRQYGYYVLPFMLDGELVGRVDLKADRGTGRLLVQASHFEPGRDPMRVGRELAAELHTYMDFLGLDDMVVVRRGDLAPHVAAHV